MLHEYAFTPHVFDANRNPDEGVWRESIRHLARILWPNPNVACPIVDGIISHLKISILLGESQRRQQELMN